MPTFWRLLIERVAVVLGIAGYVLALGVIPLLIASTLPFPWGAVGAVVWIGAFILLVNTLQDAYDENRYKRREQEN